MLIAGGFNELLTKPFDRHIFQNRLGAAAQPSHLEIHLRFDHLRCHGAVRRKWPKYCSRQSGQMLWENSALVLRVI